jgi:hypothetical protein
VLSYISVTLPSTHFIPDCVQHSVPEIFGIPECRISQSVAASAVVKSENATAIFKVLLYLREVEKKGRGEGKGTPLLVWRGEGMPSVSFFKAPGNLEIVKTWMLKIAKYLFTFSLFLEHPRF